MDSTTFFPERALDEHKQEIKTRFEEAMARED